YKILKLQQKRARIVHNAAPNLARFPPTVVRMVQFKRQHQRNSRTQNRWQLGGHRRQVIVEKELEKVEGERKEKHPDHVYLYHVEEVAKGQFLGYEHKRSGCLRFQTCKKRIRPDIV